MIALTALAAFSLITFPSGEAQSQGVVTLAGRVIPVVYPKGEIVQVPADVRAWDGFKGANVAGAEWPAPFEAPGDWSAIRAKLQSLGPIDASTPILKGKVFILSQTDVMEAPQSWNESTPGPLVQVRRRLNQAQVDAVLRSLARTTQYVRAATDGEANWQFDVEIVEDPIVLPYQLERDWVDDFVRSHTNRGVFAAEDKVFRGPYNATLVLTPNRAGLSTSLGTRNMAVYVGDGIDQPDGFGMDPSVLNDLAWAVSSNWSEFNVHVPPSPGSGGAAGAYAPQWPTLMRNKWALLATREEPTFDQVSALFGVKSAPEAERSPFLNYPVSPSPVTSNVAVSIVDDADRGKVLQYKESGTVRYGGFALPFSWEEVKAKSHLKFWMKSSAMDSITLCVENESKGKSFVPARVPAARDGKWHEVVVDLRGKAERDTRTGRIYLGPGVAVHDKVQAGDLVYLFDDFELIVGAEPTPTVPEPEVMAAAALDAAELAKLSDADILRGFIGRTTPYAATDEPALISLTKSVNVRIAGLAVQRLAELGTPTAKAEVLRLVTATPFEHVRQVAAIEVGKMGDPKNAPVLSRLFGSKSWQTRMAGATAVSLLPGNEAAVIAMTFLQENDPMVRLAATRGAHLDSPTVLKRLLWSAVNDPSDAVRAESAWKLINSGKEKEAAESYKSIRDDSVGVRLDLLARIAKNPAESHRGALRVAVVDLSARVRAAALQGFARHPGDVVLDEVSNTFTDKFPIVQLALLDLAKAKNLKLPDAAVANLKSSIDSRVVERAKELG